MVKKRLKRTVNIVGVMISWMWKMGCCSSGWTPSRCAEILSWGCANVLNASTFTCSRVSMLRPARTGLRPARFKRALPELKQTKINLKKKNYFYKM